MRVLLSLLLALLLSGCSSLNPMDMFASEDSSEPPAQLQPIRNHLAIETLWSTNIGSGTDEQRVRLVPFVDQGRLFAADRNGTLRALDSVSGRVEWSRDTGLEISGGPGAGEGLVLVGTSNAEVAAFAAETGEPRWSARVSSEVLSVPKVGNGVVVVHTIDGKLFGFDATSGEQRWIYDRTTPILTLYGSSSPVISGNLVVAGFASGKLAALNLTTGELAWEITVSAPSGRSELDRMVDIDGDPLVLDGVVYVTTYQGEMAAVTLDTGVVLWRRKLSSYAGSAADWRQLYVSDSDDALWAILPRNGSSLWKNDVLHGRKISAPAVLGEAVVVGDFEGYLHWFSQEDGRLMARSRVGKAAISSRPLVVDDVLYVYGDAGDLAALRLSR